MTQTTVPTAQSNLESPRTRALVATGELRVITKESRRVRWRDIFKTLPIAGVLALRDFKGQYKQSVLGPIWLLAQPLGILLAFTVIFNGVTQVDTSGVPYTLFVLTGISIWTFTAAAISTAPRIFIKARTLITLINAPRSVFVSAAALVAFPNLVVALLLTLASMLVVGHAPPIEIMLLPLMIAWLVIFVWFLMLTLSSINVWVRDVSSILPFFLQAGVFLTPIGYSLTDAPPALENILSLNPLTGIIGAWRWALLGSPLDVTTALIAGAWTVIVTVVGWRVFVKLEPRFADVI